MNLSHSTDNEIPQNFESTKDTTEVVYQELSHEEKIIECLREAGGESLSLSDISEETEVPLKRVERILRSLSAGQAETREVFEDENEPGSFFMTEPLLDLLAI